MFESCRAHIPSKSGRFAAMTTCSGVFAGSEAAERSRAKPACAVPLMKSGFDRGRYMLGGFQLRVVPDIV